MSTSRVFTHNLRGILVLFSTPDPAATYTRSFPTPNPSLDPNIIFLLHFLALIYCIKCNFYSKIYVGQTYGTSGYEISPHHSSFPLT